MKPVQPGEPLKPAMTAEWYNQTIRPNAPPKPSSRKRGRERHSEDFCTYVPEEGYLSAERFTAVAPTQRIGEGYDAHTQRNFYVDKTSINKFNWVVCQQTMSEGAYTQKVVYSGPTYAKVTILDESHQYVDVDTCTYELKSAPFGKGIILLAGSTYSWISIETLTATLVQFSLREDFESGVALSTITTMEGLEIGIKYLNDPRGIFNELGINDTGLALFQNNKFYAIQANCSNGGDSEGYSESSDANYEC